LKEIKVVTDISSALSPIAVEATDVEIVPMTVYAGVSAEPVDVQQTESFWRGWDSDYIGTVRIAQPTPGDFYKTYHRLLSESQKELSIVALLSSESLTSSVPAARTAADMLGSEQIQIIDSSLIGPPLGQLVLEASMMAEEITSVRELTEHVERIASNINAFFYAGNVNSLRLKPKKGISGVADSVQGMLRGDIFALQDGFLESLGMRCADSESAEVLSELILDKVKNPSLLGVMSAGAENEAGRLRRLLKQKQMDLETEQWVIDLVLGSFLGPGSVGVFAIER